jgi:hypothetical protein
MKANGWISSRSSDASLPDLQFLERRVPGGSGYRVRSFAPASVPQPKSISMAALSSPEPAATAQQGNTGTQQPLVGNYSLQQPLVGRYELQQPPSNPL